MTGTPPLPFRWDLTRPDRLGELPSGEPVWAGEITACAAKVLARAGDADLYFVGRSGDSVHDVLAGALRATSWQGRVRRLPVSLWDYALYGGPERRRLREILAATLPSPADMARGRDLAFADIVSSGATYAALFAAVEHWIADEHANWPVIRRKLRFVGLTSEGRTSPKAWRWWQHADWTSRLPAGAVVNVSLDRRVYGHLADRQPKTAPSHSAFRWWDERVTAPARDADSRDGLALARAYTAYGALPSTRAALARGIEAEPAMREAWARRLAGELRRS